MSTSDSKYSNRAMTLLDHVLLVLLGKEVWAKRVVSENIVIASHDPYDDTPDLLHLEYEVKVVQGCKTEYVWKWSHSYKGVTEHFSGNTQKVMDYIDKHVPKGGV